MYEVGDLGRFTATFRDPDTSQIIDPATVTFTYEAPDAAPVTLTYPDVNLVQVSTGSYRALVNLNAAGTWGFRWTTTGAYQGVDDFSRVVRATFDPTMPGELTPAVSDVSSLLYDMIVKEGGQIGDAFDDDTTPTSDQVKFWAAKAVDEILGRLQVVVPRREETINLAKWVATIHAARLIVRFFNTERTTDGAATTALDTMFDAIWPDLVQACRAPDAVRLS